MLNALTQPVYAALYGMNDRCGPVTQIGIVLDFRKAISAGQWEHIKCPLCSALAIAVLVLLTAIGAPSAFAQVGSTRSMTSTEPGQFSETFHIQTIQRASIKRMEVTTDCKPVDQLRIDNWPNDLDPGPYLHRLPLIV